MNSNQNDYDPLLRYKTVLDAQKAPDHLPARVMEHARAQERQDSHPSVRAKRSRWGIVTAAACIVLAAGLGLVGITLTQSAPDANGGYRSDDRDATVSTSGNFFALAAYAAENPSGEIGRPVSLALNNFGFNSSWSVTEIDPETNESCLEEGLQFVGGRFALDLTCTGADVDTVTYTLSGERVHFLLSENLTMDEIRARGSYHMERNDEFVVSYEKQASDKESMVTQIVLSLPLEGELRLISDTMMEEHYEGTDSPDTRNKFNIAVNEAFSQLLAHTTLTMTAQFTDGSTQTKTYAFAPVDNFSKLIADYHDKEEVIEKSSASDDEKNQQQQQELRASLTPLYTITQIS